MTTAILDTSSFENRITPAAVRALRAHPDFPEAMRRSAAGIAAMYQGNRLLNWLVDDRARLLFGYLAPYLDVTRDLADPSSGLTPTRMKAFCAQSGICSPGRVIAILSLMRFAGYLAPAYDPGDRRRRRLETTERLFALLRERWQLHFTAMAPLFPAAGARLKIANDPAFSRLLIRAMGDRFLSGFRFMAHTPELGVFGERNAGMLILASLLTGGGPDDTVPPAQPVTISISALARRFAVSRPHVLKLMADAAAQGLIERTGKDGSYITIQPPLAFAAQNFFATMFLFFEDCARSAADGSA